MANPLPPASNFESLFNFADLADLSHELKSGMTGETLERVLILDINRAADGDENTSPNTSISEFMAIQFAAAYEVVARVPGTVYLFIVIGHIFQ